MAKTKRRKEGKRGVFGASKAGRGRPSRPLPPRIDATPEGMARAMFALPADHQWEYERNGGAEYRCVDCGREVNYPETLYNDDRCDECHALAN